MYIKKNLLLILFISIFVLNCQSGISQEELQIMTENAVNEALEEINEELTKTQTSDSTILNNQTTESNNYENDKSTSELQTTTTTKQVTTSTTTTTINTTTTSTIPWATFANQNYECKTKTGYGFKCSTISGLQTIYCSEIKNSSNCSEYWYPEELSKYRVLTFKSNVIICEDSNNIDKYDQCADYQKGKNPNNIYFFNGQYWCEKNNNNCIDYDPSIWTKADSNTFCKQEGWIGYKCYQSYSNSPPKLTPYKPDSYCNKNFNTFNCSEYWYPDELKDYKIVESLYGTKLCKKTIFNAYSFNDYDCGDYFDGGNPNSVYFEKYKCTDQGFVVECNDDYYPSELEDYELTTIGYSGDYVCEKSYRAKCWKYYGGSLSEAANSWNVDYYCTGNECSTDDWP